MTTVSAISQQIWDMKYRLKTLTVRLRTKLSATPGRASRKHLRK